MEDINRLLDETISEVKNDKQLEIKKKIKYIISYIDALNKHKSNINKKLERLTGKIAKAESKLDELRKGNMSVLSDIDVDKPIVIDDKEEK